MDQLRVSRVWFVAFSSAQGAQASAFRNVASTANASVTPSRSMTARLIASVVKEHGLKPLGRLRVLEGRHVEQVVRVVYEAQSFHLGTVG